MIVDVDDELYRYCEHKKVIPRYTSYGCDICQVSSDISFLNFVTLKGALYFVCTDCCEKILMIDGWKSMTREEILRVLGL